MKLTGLRLAAVAVLLYASALLASAQDASVPDTLALKAAAASPDTLTPGQEIPDTLALKAAGQDSIPVEVHFKPWKDTLVYEPMDTICHMLDSVILWQTDSLIGAYDMSIPGWKDLRDADRRRVKEIRDSIRLAKPRVLEAFAVDDSLYWRRLLMWTHERKFNEVKVQPYDTSLNYYFTEIPSERNDVGSTSLGVAGSPVLLHNYFKRRQDDVFQFVNPYLENTFTPETIPLYNVKTPYTELAYWGTLFAGKLKEQDDLHLMTTQNLSPSFNFNLRFDRLGGGGMLEREKSAQKTVSITVNNLGKKYLMQAGWIKTTVERQENGGVSDISAVLDTVLDARAMPIELHNAETKLHKNTLFITHSLAIPMNFFRKDRDSLQAGEGTMAFIGHSLDFTRYDKTYNDVISGADEAAFYGNRFFINPTSSADSLSASSFDNRLFIKLQPFDADAILSRINAGVGYQMLTYYTFDAKQFVGGTDHTSHNNFYAYAGLQGLFRKYIDWNADAKYGLAGYNAGDFDLNARLKLSVYPISEGIHISGSISSSMRRPDWFYDHLHTNHFQWENSFAKTAETRIQGMLEIPKWKLEASVGYALASNLPYYDSLAFARQCPEAVNILSAYLRKDFALGIVHLDNRILYQISSNGEVVPLPKLSLHLRWYLQFNVVRDVMKMQLGADATFHTAYHTQGYNPALGVFYNQNSEMVGGTAPYVDWFVNVQWKRACVFVKYLNGLKGWPTSDYFSAYHYIKSQPAFKFGVFWPFYTR